MSLRALARAQIPRRISTHGLRPQDKTFPAVHDTAGTPGRASAARRAVSIVWKDAPAACTVSRAAALSASSWRKEKPGLRTGGHWLSRVKCINLARLVRDATRCAKTKTQRKRVKRRVKCLSQGARPPWIVAGLCDGPRNHCRKGGACIAVQCRAKALCNLA